MIFITLFQFVTKYLLTCSFKCFKQGIIKNTLSNLQFIVKTHTISEHRPAPGKCVYHYKATYFSERKNHPYQQIVKLSD